MKVNIILLLTILLISSCNSYTVICDLSFEYSRCRCQCFNLDSLEITSDDKCDDNFISGDYGIYYCENLIGVHPEEFLRVKREIKDYKRTCESNQPPYTQYY